MKISDKILRLRTDHGLTQLEFGQIAGVSDKAVSTWELGIKSPRMGPIHRICHHFNIDVNSFIDPESDVYGLPEYRLPDNIIPMPKMNTIPLLGTIACGEPILAEENIDEHIDIPEHIHADFALRCKGDSMIGARIHDGDIVYIRQQPAVDNGQIAAVLIGDEATLKRVYLSPGTLILQPENSAYQPMVYTGESLSDVRILGKVVGFTSTDIA